MTIYYLQFAWGLVAIPLLAFMLGTFGLRLAGLLTQTTPAAPNTLPGLFYRLLLGTVLGVLLYALYKSGFNTILSGLLLTFGLALIGFRRYDKPVIGHGEGKPKPIQAGPAILLGGVYLLYMGIYFLSNLNGHPDLPFISSQSDHGFYAQIGKNLSEGLAENRLPVYTLLEPSQYGNAMYHYFDSWTSAAFSDLTGLPGLETIQTYERAWFLFITLLGVCSVVQWYSALSYWVLLFISLSIIGQTSPVFYDFLPPKHHAGLHDYALFLRPSYLTKVSYLAAFFSLILLLWKRKMRVLSVCISTGLVFISGALVVWTFSCFYLTSFLLFKKNFTNKGKPWDKLFYVTFSVISVSLFYYIFYNITTIQGGSHKSIESLDFYITIKSIATFEFLRREIIYLGFLFFSTLPWVILVLLFALQNKTRFRDLFPITIKIGLILFVILFLLGSVSSFLVKGILFGDSDQLTRFSFLSLYLILLVLIAVHFHRFSIPLRFLCYVVVILDLYHSLVSLNTHRSISSMPPDSTFSDSFFEEVALQDHKSKVGGYIQNTSSNKYPDFFTTAFHNFFIYELTVLPNYYGFVSLFDDEINWDSTDAGQNATRNILFYLNYKQRPENKGLTRDQVRFKLVQEYKLDWVVTDPGMALPSYLKPHRRSKVCDPKTGFCIHYLNLKSLLAAPLPADTTIRDATSNPEPMPRTPAGAADSRAG
ncbi:MAG: hypothetical protein ACK5XP_02695 [Sphingobacteriia bacterium]|jgi:hypothetical protein